MKVSGIQALLMFLGFAAISCSETKSCYKYFSDRDLEFVSYAGNQSISLLDTSNVVHVLRQTSYRRELFELCGSIGCSGEHREVYDIAYRSTSNLKWGFNLSLYSQSCDGDSKSQLFITSDDLKSYKEDRWIFSVEPGLAEIKYKSIVVNGLSFHDVYEFSGYYNDEQITMLYSHAFGIIQIAFTGDKRIVVVPQG